MFLDTTLCFSCSVASGLPKPYQDWCHSRNHAKTTQSKWQEHDDAGQYHPASDPFLNRTKFTWDSRYS